MDFGFNEEQEMFRAMVRDFTEKEIAPGFAERQNLQAIPFEQRKQEGKSYLLGYPYEQRKKAGGLGLLGMNVEEKYGGNPSSAVTTGIAVEEISGYDCNFIMASFSSNNFIGLASEEVKEEWLPRLCSGEVYINMGATEAEAGADLGNAQTKARKDGEFWILNGEKNRVSSSMDGDALVVLAKVDPESRRLTPFLVTYDMPGVTRSMIRDISGGYAGIVSLEDVRVPDKYLLGDAEGRGFITAMETFDGMRATAGLSCMKIAQMCLDETIEYSKQRFCFGRPIAWYEGVSFSIAEMATNIELGRTFSYSILAKQDQGLKTTKESSMIKWWAPKMAIDIAHECLLLHGHYGYSADMPFKDRMMRMIATQIGDSTPHIQKMIIARELIGREYLPYRTPPARSA
ncbi:acyl-CoA dehydrogenase family protein [Chloroflexota bacterium]